MKFIDIEAGSNHKKLIDDINSCKYIISSSLHGVMMGIVYKKRTIFVEFDDKVVGNGFKFQDFFKSININYKNINTYDTKILNNVINVDYEYLVSTGIKLISLIPFIETEMKTELINKYKKFYNTKTCISEVIYYAPVSTVSNVNVNVRGRRRKLKNNL